MKPMKNFFLLSFCTLFFTIPFSTLSNVHADNSVSTKHKEIAQNFAKEFKINKIQSITIPFCMSMMRSLVVTGDEQLEEGIGRYKELQIFLEEESFVFKEPPNITVTLDECTLRIVEFVELETEVYGKVRVLTRDVNPELALNLLTKIYNSDFTLAPGVDAKDHPSKETMQMANDWLKKELHQSDDRHFMLHLPGHKIDFSVVEGNIVVQGYCRIIY